jgi:FAD/FMN-containing dehydrogenase/Fe-S oxidoreductase
MPSAAPKAAGSPVDAARVESVLRRQLRGEVRFDSAYRAMYATDGSNYRQVPIGVVFPRDEADVVAAVSIAREHGAPILCRGAGTSLAGQCCNVAVVLDFSRHMSNILEIDPQKRLARVQPGVVLDSLRYAAEGHQLTFAPDPATHDRCTIGGMIGNNSCGVHSVMGGKTDQNIEALKILTYDGVRMTVGATSETQLEAITGRSGRQAQIYSDLKNLRNQYADLVRARYPNIPRRVSGYNLNYLLPENAFHVARALVGSEGTCVTVLQATCRLVESPQFRVLLVLAWPDIFQCADHVPEILAHAPIGLEGIDDLLVEYTRRKGINSEGLALLPEGGGWLLAEFGANDPREAEDLGRKVIQHFERFPKPPKMRLFTDRAHVQRVWEVRESSLGVISQVPGEPLTWEGWEDSAVAPEKLGPYLRDLLKLMKSYQYRSTLYGHFGDGCVHNRVNFDLQSAGGIAKFRKFMEEAADLVVSYGGSLSGEHGDGQARAELLDRMFGTELVQAFREFKTIWDPEWKMNPGKVVDPNRMDENLRLGAEYRPWDPETHFKFPQDNGSLAHANLRCVGVGKCRREQGGLMCPSYRVTREEEHSTRGRAHLLWEMTQGEVIKDGWNSEEVKSSLDLCLSCKGCKSDCPVAVDLATYKAEFLSHYHEQHRRPLSDFAFGNIDRWARMASRAPALANLIQLPVIGGIAKSVLGITPGRSLPRFARQTFREWFARRQNSPLRSPRAFSANSAIQGSVSEVMLWPDTFNNYFTPQVAQAAVEVVEAAGFQVKLPKDVLCCGRPLYDFGMLGRAKELLQRVIDSLSPEITAGTPIIVLEPSCAAVFRDELLNLFPKDPRAQKLSRQVLLFSEFLDNARQFEIPKLPRIALLHGHCHQKAVMKMSSTESVLSRAGVEFSSPAPGCCGMAGSFGFQKDKYDVSLAIAELELLPAIRNASPETLIIADGFSCREQVRQCTGRSPLHLAEVLQMARREVS